MIPRQLKNEVGARSDLPLLYASLQRVIGPAEDCTVRLFHLHPILVQNKGKRTRHQYPSVCQQKLFDELHAERGCGSTVPESRGIDRRTISDDMKSLEISMNSLKSMAPLALVSTFRIMSFKSSSVG